MNRKINRLLESVRRALQVELADMPSEDLARRVGDEIGVDWDEIPIGEFRMGLAVELEHEKIDPQTNVSDDDWIITGKIALAHLKEFGDYYTRLIKVEPEIEKLRAQLSSARD